MIFMRRKFSRKISMNLKDIFRGRRKAPDPAAGPPEERAGRPFGALSFTAGCSFRQSRAMELSAVNRCVELISDSIAQLPIEIYGEDRDGYREQIYGDPVGELLCKEPNLRMTRFTFVKCLVTSMLVDGDAFAYIQRDGGKPVALHFLPVEYVTPVVPSYIDQPVRYKVTGVKDDVEERDMIHLMQRTGDGIYGVGIVEQAKKSLELAWAELEHASNFFSSGASAFGILKASGELRKEQKKELRESWNEARGGGGTMKGVVLLDEGFDYRQIALNPADSQLLESRKFTVEEICRFFGVSPTKAFAGTNSVSYNSLEQENLAFLTNTLQPILSKLELEFERKLFGGRNVVVRFNTLSLSRSDSGAQSAYLTKLLSWGVLTINEARRQLDLPPVEDGDRPLVPVNVQTLGTEPKDGNESGQPAETPDGQAAESGDEAPAETKD